MITTEVATVATGPGLDHHPAIAQGAQILRAGGLVAFPTETVYGLGADATSTAAIEAIYRAKRRPAGNPLIVHVAAPGDVERVGRIEGAAARRLLERFWPGPLTVVIPALEPVRSAVCRGLDTVAVRMPDHPVALALIRAAERPIAAPSANLSGRPSPTHADHVVEDLDGRIPLILDGGPCGVGIESTVLDLTGTRPTILRPGTVSAQAITETLGIPVTAAKGDGADRTEAVRSPGTRFRHYRPRAAVIGLDHGVPRTATRRLLQTVQGELPEETRVGYIATRLGASPLPSVELVERGGADALTQHLYDDLRRLDRRGAALIFVEGVAEDEPVMDRLGRASSRFLTIQDLDDPGLIRRLLDLAARASE